MTASRGISTAPPPEQRLTLGWQVIDWALRFLRQPDGPNAGDPWHFTNEQVRFVLNWFAVGEDGRFRYNYAMLRRAKGWGKNPLAAALAAVEFVGPCRFGGWREGLPLAVEHGAAWIQAAGVSKDSTRNLMTLFPGMFSNEAMQRYEIDLGIEKIYAYHGSARIEAVTTSARAQEGGRVTFAIKDESQHWIQQNGGLDLAEVIRRNTAKIGGRTLAISNAHAPGEGSDAEHDYERYVLGDTHMLYDSREAQESDLDDKEALRAALEYAYGDSRWVPLDRIFDERTSTPRGTYRRYYLNQLAASEEHAFDVQRFAGLEKRDYQVPDKALITLGFDGSVSGDHTALIGTEVATGHQWVVGYWEPRQDLEGNYHIAVNEVDAVIADTFARFDVWRLNADPFWWQEQLAAWAGRYNEPGHQRVVQWNTTLHKKMATALLAYHNAIQAGELTHDGDRRFVQAIGNARRHEQFFTDDNGERMWTVEKERWNSPLKIDAAVSACLSWEARNAAIAAGVLNQEELKPRIYLS